MDENVFSAARERGKLRAAADIRQPINGSIELLPLCNMNCEMCYVRLDADRVRSLGGLKSPEEWLSVARQMLDAGVLFLLLTGGEPLLYPGFSELYLQLQSMGFALTINTNGTLLGPEYAELFAQYKPRRINITLYGGSRETYEQLCHLPEGFEKTLNAVRLLLQNRVDVKLSASVTAKNAADLPKMFEIAEGFGLKLYADTYMMPAKRERLQPYPSESRLSPESAAEYRVYAMKRMLGAERFAAWRGEMLGEIDAAPMQADLRPGRCFAGRCSFAVNWQGLLRPCVITDRPGVFVFETSFSQAWETVSQAFCKIRMSDQCGACRLKPLCCTCPAGALLETGCYDNVPEYVCRSTRACFEILRAEP